jgi:hypothetical protein
MRTYCSNLNTPERRIVELYKTVDCSSKKLNNAEMIHRIVEKIPSKINQCEYGSILPVNNKSKFPG